MSSLPDALQKLYIKLPILRYLDILESSVSTIHMILMKLRLVFSYIAYIVV